MDRNSALALLLSSCEDTPSCPPQRTARFADPETFGQFLRNHREGRNVSLQQMAGTTKIAVPHLEALERGDIRMWPRGIYQRAMVRAYAATVELDPDELVHDFLTLFPDVRASASSATDVKPEPLIAREGMEQRLASAMEGLRHRITTSWRMAKFSAWSGLPVRTLRRVAGPVALVLVGYVGGTALGVPLVDRPSPPAAFAATSDSAVDGTGDRAPDAAASEPLAVPTPPGADIYEMPAEGRLVITSNPNGARVTVNGVGWGSTPITIRHLAMGEKRIRLWKDGYLAAEQDVDLTANRPTQSVQVRLRVR